MEFTKQELKILSSRPGLKHLLYDDIPDFRKTVDFLIYRAKLQKLHLGLIKLQDWVQDNNKRVMVIPEGREFAGKGGTINACIEHLNPRVYRKVALNKPTKKEKGQWYFERYVEKIPERRKIVFFDRSWYNRAVVEPVNGFCTEKEYKRFMEVVNHFEKMLTEEGIIIIKFYLSISKNIQKERIEAVKKNPLLRWQLSKVDLEAPKLWDQYTMYTSTMLEKTNRKKNPWHVIDSDNKYAAHLEVIKVILKEIPLV